MTWRTTTLGELIEECGIEIQTGPFGTQLKASEYVDSGVPVINVRNIGFGNLLDDKLEFVTDQTAHRLERHLLRINDIVFGRKGAVDRHLLVHESENGWLQGSDCIRLRITTDKLNPYFLSYSLLRNEHRQWMVTQSGNKSTMASLNQDVIKRIPLSLPSTEIQRKIAEVLQEYDHLIENNHRRIELLEQAARMLYKEWFVHFRFPGNEQVNIVDGVAEGWSRKRVSNLLERHIGGGWGQDEPTGIEIEPAYVIRGTDMASITEGKFDSIGLRYHKEGVLKSRLLQEGDIIFEVSGGSATQPVGRTIMISKVLIQHFDPGVIPASFCKLLRPNSLFVSCYLLHHLRHIRESGELQVYQKQSASALQNFNFAAFIEHHSVPVPPDSLLREFSEQITIFEKQKLNMARQNYYLSKARDLLLPRLMNGEIAI